MHEIIMGYQGEMSLKGLNRNQFESAMMKILRYRLKTVGKFKVYCTQSTFYMEPEEEDVDMDLAFDRVSKVFGSGNFNIYICVLKMTAVISRTLFHGQGRNGQRHPSSYSRKYPDEKYRGTICCICRSGPLP